MSSIVRMKLQVTVTLDVDTRPSHTVLDPAFGSPVFLEWSRDLARFLTAELATQVRFEKAEIGWSTPVAFPIALAAELEDA
jgi:hypothetical protein